MIVEGLVVNLLSIKEKSMKMQTKGKDFPGHVQDRNTECNVHEMQHTIKRMRYTA